MKYSVVIASTISMMLWASTSVAKSNAEIKQIARAATVEIKLQNSTASGSGVIIHYSGDIYTVVTNKHVVCGDFKECTQLPSNNVYSISTVDGSNYLLNVSAVTLLGDNLDLAIMQFQTKRKYAPAQIDLSRNLQANDTIYTAGFPAKKNEFVFNKGSVVAVTTKRLMSDKGGYTIIYDAATLPGMSGSGVYNTAGEMVAIHGIGDRYRLNSETDKDLYPETYDENIFERKVGSNRGISVNWLQQALIKRKINLFKSKTPNDYLVVNDRASLTADDLFFNGYNKFLEPGENWKISKRQAIQDLTDAIILNPGHALSYVLRAACYRQLQEFGKALADLNKSIQLENRSGSYQERGNLRLNNFNDVNGALEDFNKSIELGPDNAASYGNRALLKMSRIGDANGALADLNKAINIDPELALAYNNRAVLKYTKFNDSDGALADLSKAIMLNPNLSLPYVIRGGLKASKKDPSGALADINQAITLNPTLSIAYSLRGGLKADILNDTSGGFMDLEKAIELDPKNPEAYFARGFLKNKKLNDRAGAIQDFEKAIQLSAGQSKLPLLQLLREQLKQLTATEPKN